MSTALGVQWLDLQGLQYTSSVEFVEHPDYRQISSFFLGWVFLLSLRCLATCRFTRHLVTSFSSRLTKRRAANVVVLSDVEASPDGRDSTAHEKRGGSFIDMSFANASSSPPVPITAEKPTLVFAVFLCLAFASVASFSSLLAFDYTDGLTSCAFVVAWASMAAQSASMIGLVILSLELRHLGAGRWEMVAFWVSLSIATVFAFFTAAVAVGTTTVVEMLQISLCYKQHFLPSSIATSSISLILELYIIWRLVSLIAAPRRHLALRERAMILEDHRVLKALSLLFLDALTIVPNALKTSILGDYVPFSIGAVLVLAAFGSRTLDKADAELPSASARTAISGLTTPQSRHIQSVQTGVPIADKSGRTSSTSAAEAKRQRAITHMVAIPAVPGVNSFVRDEVVDISAPVTEAALPTTSNKSEGPLRSAFRSSERPMVGKIVISQVAYADQMEKDQAAQRPQDADGLKPGPPRTGPSFLEPPSGENSPVWPEDTTPTSMYYGSDIIRTSRSRRDRMKSRVSWSPSVATTAPPSKRSSHRNSTTLLSPTQSRRHSVASTTASSYTFGMGMDELQAIYAASGLRHDVHGKQPAGASALTERLPEASTLVLTPRPPTIPGLPAQPRLRPSEQRASVIRGPRPPHWAARSSPYSEESHLNSSGSWEEGRNFLPELSEEDQEM